jgi:hypothetical protein
MQTALSRHVATPRGYGHGVDQHPDEARVEHRAQLLPEEEAAGSDDPHRQAEVVLEDSDERTAHPEQTEHESAQTPD